jgi:two-component system, sensor histidine kinase
MSFTIAVSTTTRMSTTDLFRRRTRVIVIEDNRDSAGILRLLLDLHGYDVRVAHTGPEGVRLAQEWPPEVVLCAIGLPGLDGYGVAAALRRDPATAQARLVAVTAYGSDADRQRCQEVGFDRHLVKPVDPGVLLELLAAR